MDLSSLSFAFILIGGIAACYFVAKMRFKQTSYEYELLIEWNKQALEELSPSVGDSVYLYSLSPHLRRSSLGTNTTLQSAGGLAHAMGDKLYTKQILGVISAIDGTSMRVETFGFQGKDIWFVVDSGGSAIPVGKLGTVMNLTTASDDQQIYFTGKETGGGNAILRNSRRM